MGLESIFGSFAYFLVYQFYSCIVGAICPSPVDFFKFWRCYLVPISRIMTRQCNKIVETRGPSGKPVIFSGNRRGHLHPLLRAVLAYRRATTCHLYLKKWRATDVVARALRTLKHVKISANSFEHFSQASCKHSY